MNLGLGTITTLGTIFKYVTTDRGNMKQINWERIGVYVATAGLVFMFWQSMRDIHNDISDIKERLARLETKIEWPYNTLGMK